MTIEERTTPSVEPIVPTRPPKYPLGTLVVLRGYETGWRWTVTDAEPLRRKNPFWSYRVETTRPYDGKPVWFRWPEWKLRPAPVVAAGDDQGITEVCGDSREEHGL